MSLSTSGIRKYDTFPTRIKIRIGWITVLAMGATWQFLDFALFRVQAKRQEEYYERHHLENGDCPVEFLQDEARKKQAMQSWTLKQAVEMQSIGEETNDLSPSLDYRVLADIKRGDDQITSTRFGINQKK